MEVHFVMFHWKCILLCFSGSAFCCVSVEVHFVVFQWKCPVCNKAAEVDNLMIDGFFMELLKYVLFLGAKQPLQITSVRPLSLIWSAYRS